MGVSPAVFESAGKKTEHLIPGVYTRRNTVAATTGLGNDKLVVMGVSSAGKPRTLLKFATPADAKNALLGGELLNGVLHAFNGSNDFVPQYVYGYIVNSNTQATLVMKNGDNPIINVKSSIYGVPANQLKLWLKSGTTGKKLMYSFKGNEGSIDNIERPSFSIIYNGDGTSPKCTITSTGIKLEALEEGEAVDVFEFAWTDIETVSELVSRINDTDIYAATLLDLTEGAATKELDVCSATALSTTATKFYSNVQALIEALEKVQYIGSGNAELAENASRILPDNNDGYVYFSGATAGTSTVGDWSDALDALAKEKIQSITTPSTDKKIHVLISNHCASCNTVAQKKERMFLVGMAYGSTLEQGIAEAAELNSEYGSLVINGMKASNPLTGESEYMSGALLACKAAGMENSMGSGNPLTNKVIKVTEFTGSDDYETMIANGIMPFGKNDDDNLVCIRAMTTYQSDNLALNERSCVREALFMDRDFRAAYSRKIGTNDAPDESDIKGILIARAEVWYKSGLITKNDKQEDVFNIRVRFDADKTYVEYDRFLRTPNNFIFGTSNNLLYKSEE